MTNRFLLAGLLAVATGVAGSALGDDMYSLNFHGVEYQANGSGRIVSSPITQDTLVNAAAKDAGIKNSSNLTLVYHVNGSSFGDTIDVVRNDGSVVVTYFGLFFGTDPSLGRMNLTSGNDNLVKEVDYVYTQQTTQFTTPNSHSMGAVVVTKRYTQNNQGNSRLRVQGQNMQWIAAPQDGQSSRVFQGAFVSKQLFNPVTKAAK